MSTSPPPPGSLTLADLEEASGTSARTIRYYQAEGLLPRPERRGGKAVYGPAHLERLRAIACLQAEGLRLQTIRTVLGDTGEPSRDQVEMVDLLGPSVAGSAWLATSVRTLDEGELADLLGDDYPEQVGALVQTGYLERRTGPDGRRSWFAPNVPQLRGALELYRLGTDFTLSRWGADLLRDHLREASEQLIARWITESGSRYDGDPTSEGFARNFERIRAVAWQSAAHTMAEEIGHAMRRADEIAAGVAMGVPAEIPAPDPAPTD